MFHRLRNFSEDDSFIAHVLSLHNTLFGRDYPLPLIANALNRATAIPQNDVLLRKRTPVALIMWLSLLIFTLTSLTSTSFRNVTWTFYTQTKNVKQFLYDAPFTTFTKLPRIRNLLSSSKIIQSINSGCNPYGSSRCQLCKLQMTSSEFTSYTFMLSMKITHFVEGKTPYIIYVLYCQICLKRYVGECQT